MEQNPIRLGVIGYGGMGSWHTKKVAKLPEIELAGVYDIKPERQALAKENGIHAYASMEALLSDESISLVTVAVPNHLHREICIAAMDAGKNVICEKPVAMNSTELQEMIDAANRNGVLFTVHQNRRWDEDFRIVRKLYEENTLGRIFRIESRTHGSRGIPGDWRNQKQYGGGMLMDWGVHLLDQLLWMLPGKILSVYAQMSYVTNEDCDDGFTAQLIFENDVAVEVQVATSNFIGLPRWYVLGENGTASIERWTLEGKIVKVAGWEKREAVPVVSAAGITDSMVPRTNDTIKEYPLPRLECDVRDFYRNVVKALHGEEPQIVTHAQAMRVMRLMEAIRQSAATNTVIKDFDLYPPVEG